MSSQVKSSHSRSGWLVLVRGVEPNGPSGCVPTVTASVVSMGDDEVEEEGGDDGPIEEVEEEAISVGLVEG